MNIFIRNSCYKLIFEKSLDAMMLTNPDGKVYKANPVACKMLQRTEAEIIEFGRNCVADSEDPRLLPALKERADKGEITAELTFIRKDSTKFPVYLTSAIFIDEEDKIWSFLIFRDISAQKQAEEKLKLLTEENEHKAITDQLTGTLNRRGFIKKLEEEVARSKRNNFSMCLIMTDIDRFKEINDNYGHLYGDQVLKTFAQELSNNLRPYDFLGRFGGDEFIICLPNTYYHEAMQIAERIRKNIEKMGIIINESTVIKITCSLGASNSDSASELNIDNLISLADKNMYITKKNPNCVYGTISKDKIANALD